MPESTRHETQACRGYVDTRPAALARDVDNVQGEAGWYKEFMREGAIRIDVFSFCPRRYAESLACRACGPSKQ